jgi:fructan beta-fructosidase
MARIEHVPLADPAHEIQRAVGGHVAGSLEDQGERAPGKGATRPHPASRGSRNVNFDTMPGGPGLQLVTDGRLALKALDVRTLKSSWVVGESTFHTNITDPWYPASGTWSDVSGGKQGTSSGDLSTRTGTNFEYEGDVTVASGTAAALTMRANRDATQHYTVNVDIDAGVVKLWRPGRDIATYPTPLERNRTYHLKARVVGDHFQMWLDGSAQPVIDATDDAFGSGQFGINLFRGTAVMQNVVERPLP